MGSVVFTIAVAAPWVGVVFAALLPVSAGTAARAAASATATGAVAALAIGLLVVSGVPMPSREVWAGDALAVLMLVLVLGLSGVIQLFALRYLRGDPRQRWFAIWANALTGSTVVMACAATVIVFAAGWIAAGASLVFLLNTYRWLPQARQGVLRTALSFAIADLFLITAVVLLVVTARGDVRLSDLAGVAAALPQPTLIGVAVLLVISALARSAQLPFHRWLPATLAAPTPVSALLHAGVVNAGAILIIRFSPLIAPVAPAMMIVFTAGAATLIYATAVRLVKPDVKGRLVFSTAGQMGFMMMAVGLGAFAAAVFHLSAHALYKSALFLFAGKGVAAEADQRTWPAPQPARRAKTVAAILVASVLTLAVLAWGKALLAPQITPTSLALLGFVAATSIVAATAGLRRTLTTATLATTAIGVSGLGLFYIAFLSLFEHLIAPAAPVAAASPWLLLIPATLLLAVEFLVRSPRASGVIQRELYAWTLAASAVSPPSRPRPASIPHTQKELVE